MKIINQDPRLRRAIELAAEHDGWCVSTEFTSYKAKYWFQCTKGHKWETSISNIFNGNWCPTCRKETFAKKEIKKLHKIAEERGGKCHSPAYISSYHKLDWECAEGHKWSALPGGVKNGSWCRICGNKENSNNPQEELKKLKTIAKQKGGDCLSTSYVTAKTKLEWSCEKGHRWKAEPYSIKRGTWCPECSKTKKRSLDEMQQIAKNRGGKCLSTVYQNLDVKLEWECAEGHRWMAASRSVANRKSWCPHCANEARKVAKFTLNDMHILAKSFNGKCLSTTFVSMITPIEWECKRGHMWTEAPTHVKSGKRCPTCQVEDRRKDMLNTYKELAKERGGKCLTETYINGTHKLEWECKYGHQWEAYTHNIVGGSWCPICRNRTKGLTTSNPQTEKKMSIEDMEELAQEHGGHCLSSSYEDIHTPLKWMCNHSHAWYAPPTQVRRGLWCPICRRKNNKRVQEYWAFVKQMASERGGRCVSEEYINKRTKLEWECAEGHRWMTAPETIKKGSWCPTCSRKRK
ncbi:hypothetical protein CN918_30540 [Priestia megaterium]|nr:hypothetical protein CN918_30540 [Priestia megaterium]